MLAATTLACVLIWAAAGTEAFPQVPNGDFQQGDHTPTGWTLKGGQGRWVDHQRIEVSGKGRDANQWHCDYRFVPGSLYRFQTRARGAMPGAVVAGASSVNRDFWPTESWKTQEFVFRAQDHREEGQVWLGQWHVNGSVQFESVRLTPVVPIYQQVADDVILGEGEFASTGRYTFTGRYRGTGSNFHRPILRATAGFNTDRWVFQGGNEVVYCFALPGHRFRSADVKFQISHYSRGQCLAEVSRDQKEWRTVATGDHLGATAGAVPAEWLPCKNLYLRVTATPGSMFQVNEIALDAALDGPALEGVGRTLFADVQSTHPGLVIEQATVNPEFNGGQLRVRNQTGELRTISLSVHDVSASSLKIKFAPSATVAAGGAATLNWSVPDSHRLRSDLQIMLGDSAGRTHLVLPIVVSDFDREDYGQRLDGRGDLWWCDATHKIPPHREAPTTTSAAMEFSAARHDREAVQIVIRPDWPLHGLTASVGSLRGPGGAVIPAKQLQILRVAYHFVHCPTEAWGLPDWWPDALPPLGKPLDLPAGKNQPLWVLVHVPRDARAGDYQGQVTLTAEGWSATVPLRLHVWNFALPQRNHIETGFGLDPGAIFRYHQVKTEADRRQVMDMYLQSFADHRISPYFPTPLDPIHVKFLPQAKPPRAEVDFSQFDKAMTRAVEHFHFTNFRLPLQGLRPAKIDRFSEETPEYQSMFSSYVKQLEDHFRVKGWLKMPYVYWYDEPEPKDYPYVRAGMERLKRYAPGLTTLLTEQPEEALGSAIDIWCPGSPHYDQAKAKVWEARGARFWWYVCMGPRAPYCTLFIDHPATDLRVWVWQTWQRRISGILVWGSNVWPSDTAFPHAFQNPYLDPMSYAGNGKSPPGTKSHLGNGDGRFVYPPEAAAVPDASGPGPILVPPVSSLRWEMLREGIEDYEFLYLLRERLDQRRAGLRPDQIQAYEALLEVPTEITSSATTFTTDPAPIYARRAAVAEAIEQLGEE